MWRPTIAPSAWDEAHIKTICRGSVVDDVFREMGSEFIKGILEAQGIQLQLSESDCETLKAEQIGINDDNRIFYAIQVVLPRNEAARNAVITALIQLATAEDNSMRYKALDILSRVFDKMMSPLRDEHDWFSGSHGKFTVLEDKELSLRILQVSFGDILPDGVSVDKLYEKMREDAFHMALNYGHGERAHRPEMERSLAFTRVLRDEIRRILGSEV